MMASCASRSAVTETTAGNAAAVLADVGQLVDVFDPVRGLEDQRFESGRDRRPELGAQRLGARDELLRIGHVGRRDLVHHFGGGVAEHPLGADVEDLDDALRVGRDAREVGAVEDRPLQRARSSAAARDAGRPWAHISQSAPQVRARQLPSAAASAGTRGRSMEKTHPSPGRVRAEIRPSFASTAAGRT